MARSRWALQTAKSDMLRAVGPTRVLPTTRGILALLGVVLAVPAFGAAVGIGARLPHIVLPDVQERSVALGEVQAPVVIVDFWATWCAPCREALPAYADLVRRYAPRAQLVAINIDRDRQAAERFLDRYFPQRNATLLFDMDNRVMGDWGAPGMPSVYVAVNGVIRFVHAGYDAQTRDTVERLVREAVQAAPATPASQS